MRALAVRGCGLRVNAVRVSPRTAGERHGNEVTPVEMQRPAGPPCLSVSANKRREKKGRASQFVLPSSSPPLPLCLDFIWQVGGAKGGGRWGGLNADMAQGLFEASAIVCVCARVCACISSS